MTITLQDLFQDFPEAISHAITATPVTGVVSDSRQVQPGQVFVAVKGGSFDGHQAIPAVLAKGAAAVVGSQPGLELPVPYIQVQDARRAIAYLAAAFYGFPARKLTMIGITGTDGKTTTTNLLYQMLLAAGLRAGMISTVNAVIGEQVLDTGFHVTTPEAVDVQRYLALMVEAGLTHAIIETTSHGWAQYRVDACEFDIGVITNITHEHLNDHGSFENYRQAKARLFRSLAETRAKPQGNPRLAVLNADDGSCPFLAEICAGLPGVRTLRYSRQRAGDLLAGWESYDAAGVHFTAQGPAWQQAVHSPLLGGFNVSNILAALAAAVDGLGLAPAQAAQGVSNLAGIPGRMERIDLGQDFLAIVDFAHTPNALARALETARQMTSGRVIVVFGSAGLRDRQKRVMMAETAARVADLTVLTAEDPRTESLDFILAEMAAGVVSQGGVEGETFWRVPDRGRALEFALELARPGDLVMACGKGHEQSMCFGTTEYAWDDRTAMRAALSKHLGLPGPEMPYLPTRA